MSDDPESVIDDLKNQRRTNTEASADEPTDDTPSLVDAVADALQEIDEDNLNPTFGFRDENLVALLDGLESTGQLEAVITQARESLGDDSEGDFNRSEACRLLLRVGLQALDEQILVEAGEGRKQFIESKADSESF